MIVKFCNNCDNLLYLYTDDENKLYLACKSCGNKEIYKDNGLSEDETFELQQHLLSNIDKLEEPERKLLRDLSQKAN